jgi:hypothetical protein
MKDLRPPRPPGGRSRRRAVPALAIAALAALALAIMGSGTALASPARAASPAAAAATRAAARPSSPAASGTSGLAMMPGTSPSIAPMTDGGYWVAYQDTAGNLNIVWPGGHTGTGLGMEAGTSPSIVALSDGTYEVAFQDNHENLWVYSSGGVGMNLNVKMAASSSPAIAASLLDDGSMDWEVAVANNDSYLETVQGYNGPRATTDQGIYPGSSPAITAFSDDQFEEAFAGAGDSHLVWVGAEGIHATDQGIQPGTSPAIADVSNYYDDFVVAFEAAGSYDLITIATRGGDLTPKNWGLGMMNGTSPAIIALPTMWSFQVGFQANTGDLWSVGDAGNRDYGPGLAMMAKTSPAIAWLAYGSYEAAFQAGTGDLQGDLSTAGPGLPASPAPATGASATPAAPHKKAAATCTTSLSYAGPTWMGDLAPCLQSQKLGDIVIPGSHDTTTFSIGNPADHSSWQTQDASVADQASDGVRQFDIRVEADNDQTGDWDWYAHHGSDITDGVSTWLTLTGIFNDIANWARTSGREHEVLIVSLSMAGEAGDGPSTNDVAACQGFGQEMGNALVTPSDFAGSFGTTDPAQLTLNQLWSLPDPNGYARVILDNTQCMGDAHLDAGTWIDGPGYYANQCTANGSTTVGSNGDQQDGIKKLVLEAVQGRDVGNGGEPSLPTPTNPPQTGGLYNLQISGTPAGDCLIGHTPWDMVPDEEIVLAALYSQWQTNAATRQNLNIVSADYVDYKGFDFFKDVITMDEVKFGVPPGVPLAPTITQLFPGDGGVSLGWTEVNGPGLDPVTSYTVTATNETDPKAPPVTFTISDTDGVWIELTNGDSYVFTVTANNDKGASPPAQAGPVTVG